MDDSDIPGSDTYSSLRPLRTSLWALGLVAVIGGIVVMMTGYRWDGRENSGLELGILGIVSGILMFGMAALMSAVESIGESARATQVALRDHLARLKSERSSW